jgi:hypothetical protein
MKPEDLAAKCCRSINAVRNTKMSATIIIKMPENRRRTPKRRMGKGGPEGSVVSFGYNGMDTVIFNAADVLAWLVATGAIKMEEVASE